MQFNSDFSMSIDGLPVVGAATLDVINPATGAVFAQAPRCSHSQLDLAIAAANRAFKSWSATPYAERQEKIRQIGVRLADNADALAMLLTTEQGKPYRDAYGEIQGAAWWCAEVAKMELPLNVSEDNAQFHSETRRVPLGVVGAIVPWNFPVSIAFLKVPAALLTGNCMILKPAPTTPLTTLKIGELLQDILPPGVLNVVAGGDELGPWITEHPGIAKISFTGSSATGKRVVQSSSQTLKRVTLELGGNDAAIVMGDANIPAIAEQIFWSAFTNAGQICMATKRLYVHEAVYDALATALVTYAGNIKLGNGADETTGMGPIQNELQFKRVRSLLDDIASRGQKVLIGGTVPDTAGFFVPITIVDNPAEDSPVVAEEAFGPVLPMMKFTDIEDVIAKVNASPYGLAGSVWSSDLAAAAAVAERIDSGTVWVNNWFHLTPLAPFGGHRQSGYGVESGMEGLLEYTNTQTIVRAKAA
jgi:acyl-CoA reductase-like NAD-dependent aldehyde dehydrogenase